SVNKNSIRDNTSDRSATRNLGYIEFKGEEIDIDSSESDYYNGRAWFKRIKITEDKIVLYMPNLENGSKAREYWHNIDNGKINPYMLFWIAIQQ
ncbi:MAG TPA: hypothetical protein PLO89_06430, partial [Spirochaetota bacterium]|nr:hypothetical protein [Spirochaetota bacterium]